MRCYPAPEGVSGRASGRRGGRVYRERGLRSGGVEEKAENVHLGRDPSSWNFIWVDCMLKRWERRTVAAAATAWA
jgi:hypothetical protein